MNSNEGLRDGLGGEATGGTGQEVVSGSGVQYTPGFALDGLTGAVDGLTGAVDGGDGGWSCAGVSLQSNGN